MDTADTADTADTVDDKPWSQDTCLGIGTWESCPTMYPVLGCGSMLIKCYLMPFITSIIYNRSTNSLSCAK